LKKYEGYWIQGVRSKIACGKLDKKRYLIGLHLCVVCGAVSSYRSAFFAFMNDYISLFRVGQNLYGTKLTVTFLGSVAGIYVNVQRPKAKRAVIS
jgi:hypothetical protein